MYSLRSNIDGFEGYDKSVQWLRGAVCNKTRYLTYVANEIPY